MSVNAFDALEAGLLALGFSVHGTTERTDKPSARKVLASATSADPMMADAWLARLAAGETSLTIYEGLWRARDNIGKSLQKLGKRPEDLSVKCALMLINYPLVSADVATAAYIDQLVLAGRFADAERIAGAEVGPQRPLTTLAATFLYVHSERWPQVIESARTLREYPAGGLLTTPAGIVPVDVLLVAAARVVTVQAMAYLGLYKAAIELSKQAVDGRQLADLLPASAATMHYFVGMCHRAGGDEDQAQESLRSALVANSGFSIAHDMLNNPGLGLQVIDQALIDSRTDPWDPATAADPAVLAEELLAGRRKEVLAEAEAELAALIGLPEVKRRVGKLRASVVVNRARAADGLPPTTRGNHLSFEGPPGTGKTVVARIVAKIFFGLGILKSDRVKEVRKADLVGQFIGETENLTNAAIDAALDGVLFIDEAYALVTSGSKNDFGNVVVDTLLARMENERDRLVVIVAGYADEMQLFYAANDGIRGRFGTIIPFPSYGVDELLGIAGTILAKTDHRFAPEVTPLLSGVCSTLKVNTSVPPLKSHEPPGTVKKPRPQIDIVGNGRFIRNAIEEMITEQQFRLEPQITAGEKVDHGLLTVDDARSALNVVVPQEFQEEISWG